MQHDVRTGRTARRGRKGVTLLAALGSCVLLAASAAPAAAHGGGYATRYVALGDSYTSGPLVPRQVDAYCARSDHNYPSVVAGRLRAAVLEDVSCSGATTENMWKPQGTKSPQLDAVGRNSDIVSVQIGGNDIGFGSIIGTCAQLAPQDPTGNPCQRHYGASGVDELTLAIARTGPKVARVLRAVHERAPHARVLVVGYPDLLPDDGSGCAPSVPFATRDFAYLRDTGKRLNLMLRLVARWGGAEYVDTYGPTVGHDMCKPTAQRWIEPLQPASPAAPAHPNAKGEEAMAGAVLERLSHRHGGH